MAIHNTKYINLMYQAKADHSPIIDDVYITTIDMTTLAQIILMTTLHWITPEEITCFCFKPE